MSGAAQNEAHASASSSSHSPAAHTPPPPRSATAAAHDDDGDENDELDLLGDDDDLDDARRRQVLDDDPIHEGLDAPMSFKRKQKPSLLSSPSRFLSALTGGRQRSASRGTTTPPNRDSPVPFNINQSPRRNGAGGVFDKDGAPLDWNVEGPGRRVGYADLTAIDWIFEYTKERQRMRVLSSNTSGLLGYVRILLDASQAWVILILTGLAVGAIAAIINVTTDWLGDLKLGFCSSGPEGGHFYLNKGFCCYGYDQDAHCAGWKSWSESLGVHAAGGQWFIEYIFFLVFSVLFAYCGAILVREYAIHAKHSGIPEIKTVLGGFVIRRFLGAWTLVTKSLGLILAVASGMWLGKEGPLVHVACCCANIFTKLFGTINGNEARKREILSAAAAAGISVAFGSPIGGVLFSLEQLSYYFPDKTMWQSFVCAMTAAVSLQAFDPFRSGKLVLYQTKYSRDWHGFEIFPYAILGILGVRPPPLHLHLNT